MENHIKFLEDSLSRFDNAETRKGYLKKRSERDSEERTMENEIQIVQRYLERNDDIHQVFMNEHSDFAYEEALSQRYFSKDMHRFLDHLRKK